MKFLNGTARVLILYVILMIVGQAVAVGIGLALDRYSKTLALSVFIPLYYAMYWVAWRIALFIADDSRELKPAGDGPSPGQLAIWLLAPAAVVLELCD